MTSLDTNVVLRLLLDDVPDQTFTAKKIIEKNKVYVTDVIVVEIIYVLEKVMLLSRKDISDLLIGFLGFSNVIHNPYFLTETIKFYEVHPSLSIVDCYASAEAKAYHNKLATFDKQLVSQGGKHVDGL
jgi:predicted nucleic-acid-binding protein